MEYAIMGIVYGLCLFLLPLWAYRRGIQDGLNLGRGVPPEPLKGPVAAIAEHREAKKAKEEADQFMEGLSNLFSYDGTDQRGGAGR